MTMPRAKKVYESPWLVRHQKHFTNHNYLFLCAEEVEKIFEIVDVRRVQFVLYEEPVRDCVKIEYGFNSGDFRIDGCNDDTTLEEPTADVLDAVFVASHLSTLYACCFIPTD